MPSKRKAQKQHAKKRARERYGLLVNKIDIENLINAIQNNKGEFIYRSSNRATVWKLKCKGKEVLVVYDKLRGQIVTFLPFVALEKYKTKQEKRVRGKCV